MKVFSGIHRVASTDASDESKQLKRKAKQLKMSEQSIYHVRARVFFGALQLIPRKSYKTSRSHKIPGDTSRYISACTKISQA
jgi:hypothetical protein